MNDQKENDLMLNMSPIIKHQIDEMKKAQQSIITGGEDKKAYVMKKIKDNMNDENYERYVSFEIEY